MNIVCDYCGKVFKKHGRPNTRRGNYCCAEHRHLACYKIYTCCVCGKQFERKASSMKDSRHAVCGKECLFTFHSRIFSRVAKEQNPTKMNDPKIREKISTAQHERNLGSTSYRKVYGRHEHRMVAERILGRSLKPGEIVHHIDGNKRNNDPSNLMIMSQAEHARLHLLQRYGKA